MCSSELSIYTPDTISVLCFLAGRKLTAISTAGMTRTPDQYTVAEILLLTEGSLAPVSCLVPGAPACERLPNCRTYAMWKGLNDMIADYFGKITLADLAAPDQAGNDYII